MGVSDQRHAPAALYSRGKNPRYPLDRGAGWAPESVWKQILEEKSSASVGDRTPVVQSLVNHCTDWATPANILMYIHDLMSYRPIDKLFLGKAG
jgi:hypothetical protein